VYTALLLHALAHGVAAEAEVAPSTGTPIAATAAPTRAPISA
jgi:hypothetical protein